uniref:Uncharacterized protein n=1 Tax=Lepeophtheirus salmonis TaxID=72036 RepID=A0A0K2T5Z6_LEPSM
MVMIWDSKCQNLLQDSKCVSLGVSPFP